MSNPRQACKTCPWLRSTPPGGFPGGCVDERELREMASGDPSQSRRVMQCHSTPDTGPKVCVGFAARVGGASFGYRLAGIYGMLDEVSTSGDFLDLEEMIDRHNTSRGLTAVRDDDVR